MFVIIFIYTSSIVVDINAIFIDKHIFITLSLSSVYSRDDY